jgi:hypothetical protein
MEFGVWGNLEDHGGRESNSDSEADDPRYMDPKLWGDLQYYRPLESMIFAKLPLREFFQLRCVCREWNRLADDRKFLKEANPTPIQKPYFHLCRRGPDFQLHGFLTYSSWRKQWDFACLGLHDALDSMVANQGLIFSYQADDNTVLRVFDIHSRIWYVLPELDPELVRPHYERSCLPVVALKVDTSSYPYEFQVIRAGGPKTPSPTHVYDSRTNTWCVNNRLSFAFAPAKATCAQVSDAVYVWSSLEEVYCYNLKEDRWHTLFGPEVNEHEPWLTGVGAWKEKVYHLSDVFGNINFPNRWSDFVMYAWDEEEEEWEESDRMPAYLRDWFISDRYAEDCHAEDINTSYCDELVLIYSYFYEKGKVHKYVLYNLETREWEIPDIPDGLVQPFLSDGGEDVWSFDPGYHCWHGKKPRGWVMYESSDTDGAIYESSDTDGEQEPEQQQPATLDEWNNFLDRL